MKETKIDFNNLNDLQVIMLTLLALVMESDTMPPEIRIPIMAELSKRGRT